MTESSDVHIRRLDGTLLLVFVEAMRTRKLTTVADRLGLTPSAVSHAVGRLRDIFGDPLFQRRPDGVEPTERALALAQPMAAALDRFREALDAGTAFDPRRLERVFRIAALDYTIALVATSAVQRVVTRAPGVQISFVSCGRAESIRKLADREIDCAVGVFGDPPAGFVQRPMLRDRFVTVARRGHPKIGAALDLETFLALDHLIVSAAGDFVGAVDRALEPMGLKRRVVAAMPQFLATFATVAETDLIVTVPAGLAADHAERFGLAVYELPLAMDPINVVILAAPGPVPDRGVAWLLDTMADASGCMLEAKVVGTG